MIEEFINADLVSKRDAVSALLELNNAIDDEDITNPDEGEYDPIRMLRVYIEQSEHAKAEQSAEVSNSASVPRKLSAKMEDQLVPYLSDPRDAEEVYEMLLSYGRQELEQALERSGGDE